MHEVSGILAMNLSVVTLSRTKPIPKAPRVYVTSLGKKILYQFSTILSLSLKICFSTSHFQ